MVQLILRLFTVFFNCSCNILCISGGRGRYFACTSVCVVCVFVCACVRLRACLKIWLECSRSRRQGRFEYKKHHVNQPFSVLHNDKLCGVHRPVGIVWIVTLDGLDMY